MTKTIKTMSITVPFFSHDISTRETKEIKKIIRDMGYEGYGLFWAIVEFMHQNELMVGEENLVINDNYTEKVKEILNNYSLFYTQDGFYISDRILRNINQQEVKGSNAKKAVETRWLLSDFCSEYAKVFGEKPVLEDFEIEKLKKLNRQIDDLRSKFPAIFKTLICIKFDLKNIFLPRANWLLKDNNLHQILNGQYGPLKTTISEDEKKAQLEKMKEAKAELNLIKTREEAIAYAVKYSNYAELDTSKKAKEFMSKWDFTLKDYLNNGGSRGC